MTTKAPVLTDVMGGPADFPLLPEQTQDLRHVPQVKVHLSADRRPVANRAERTQDCPRHSAENPEGDFPLRVTRYLKMAASDREIASKSASKPVASPCSRSKQTQASRRSSQ